MNAEVTPALEAITDRLDIQPKSRWLDPVRPLMMLIALLLLSDAVLGTIDPTLIDLQQVHYLAWMHQPLVLTIFYAVSVGALIGIWRDRWQLIAPQQILLFILTAGALRLAVFNQADFNGQLVHISTTRALAAGSSIILLTGFHAVSLYVMAFKREVAFTLAHEEIDRLARVIGLAEASKLTLKSAREINDSICQEIVVARQMIALGDFDEQAAEHLDTAFLRSQKLITDLLRSTGLETIPAGEAKLEAA